MPTLIDDIRHAFRSLRANGRVTLLSVTLFAVTIGATSAIYAVVEAVTTCAVGNPWGVSNAAMPSYEKMIKSFSKIYRSISLDASCSELFTADDTELFVVCVDRWILVRIIDPLLDNVD